MDYEEEEQYEEMQAEPQADAVEIDAEDAPYLDLRDDREWQSELEEWRDKAYHSAKIYKEKTKKWHDNRIKQKDFKPGDKVLLFNSRIKLFGHGKLRSKWKGPYSVIEAMPHGAITLQDDNGKIFKVNGHRLKIFLEPNYKEYDVINFIEET